MPQMKTGLLLVLALATLTHCSAAQDDTSTSTTTSALVLPNWTVVPSPNVTNANVGEFYGAQMTSASDGWAVGISRVTGVSQFRALTERLVNGNWQLVNSANIAASDDTRFYSIAGRSADLWAVGSDWPGGDLQNQHGLIEHFDGQAFSRVAAPANEPGNSTLSYVSSASAGDVWAVGYSRDTNASFHPLIEHWNGSAWSVVNGAAFPGSGFDRLEAVAAIASNDVWVLGSSGRHPKPVFEHWDGSAWTIVAQPANGFDSIMYGISALATNDIWAVGSQGAEHWDGTAWTLTSIPTLLVGVAALASNDVWAVGGTSTFHFDGTSWTSVPNPSKSLDTTGTAPSTLYAVAGVPNGPLFALGARDNGRATLILEH
jgi:hypothetical protein